MQIGRALPRRNPLPQPLSRAHHRLDPAQVRPARDGDRGVNAGRDHGRKARRGQPCGSLASTRLSRPTTSTRNSILDSIVMEYIDAQIRTATSGTCGWWQRQCGLSLPLKSLEPSSVPGPSVEGFVILYSTVHPFFDEWSPTVSGMRRSKS